MTTLDHDALLQAILEHPEDDALRLVYADFLEEFGDDNDRFRAAFIRVQLEIASLESIQHDCGPNGEYETTCPACGAYAYLEELRCQEANFVNLNDTGKGDCLGVNLPPLKPVEGGCCAVTPTQLWLANGDYEVTLFFCRGFPYKVLLDAATFLRYARELFQTLPLEDVLIDGAPEPVPSAGNGCEVDFRAWRPYLLNAACLESNARDSVMLTMALADAIRRETRLVLYASPELARAAVARACVAFGRAEARRGE